MKLHKKMLRELGFFFQESIFVIKMVGTCKVIRLCLKDSIAKIGNGWNAVKLTDVLLSTSTIIKK